MVLSLIAETEVYNNLFRNNKLTVTLTKQKPLTNLVKDIVECLEGW